MEFSNGGINRFYSGKGITFNYLKRNNWIIPSVK